MYSINWQNENQEHPFCKFYNSGYSDADKKGPAVYTSRALLRGIDNQRQEYMHDCEKVFPISISNRETENQKSNSIANIETSYSITPNPANSFVTIVHKGDFNLIQISEMNGRVVFESALNTNENSETFDFSMLSNGIYIVSLIAESKTERLKLIINK